MLKKLAIVAVCAAFSSPALATVNIGDTLSAGTTSATVTNVTGGLVGSAANFKAGGPSGAIPLYVYSLTNISSILSPFGLEYEITAGAGKAFDGVGYGVSTDGASADFEFCSDAACDAGHIIQFFPGVTGSHGVVGFGDIATLFVHYTGNASDGAQLDSITARFQLTAVPEPSTWAIMLLGFAGLCFAGVRRTKAALVAARSRSLMEKGMAAETQPFSF
jgi:hypothetical protein